MAWKRNLILIAAVLCACVSGCDRSGNDDHDHPHPHPHADEEENAHGHEHGDGHDHGDAHGGHDHGDDHDHGGDHGQADDHGHGHGHEEGPEPVSVTQFTPKVLLFMEYPRLIRGQPARFLAHVTVLETGEPVRAGRLVLRYADHDGNEGELVAEKPARDGLFIPEGAFAKPGHYHATIVLQSDQVQDLVELPELTVHSDEASARAAAEKDVGPEPDGAVPFLLEQQWKIGTQVRQATRKSLAERIATSGEIEATPGGMAAVSAPVSGRLVREGESVLPSVGDRVEAGQVLGRIELPLPPVELAVRQAELSAKALEFDRNLDEAAATLDYAKAAFTRAKALREKGLGTDEQLDAAQHDLRLAEVRHRGAAVLKASYDNTLKRFGEATGSQDQTLTLSLRAPIAGQVVSVNRVEGEHVESGDEVLRVVNAERVWVVAHLPESDAPRLGKQPGAIVSPPGAPEQAVDVLAIDGGRLVNIGLLVDQATRTLPIRYELPNPRGRFRVGMSVEVQVAAEQSTDAVVIPASAIVMDNGRPTAYVMLDGETFQKRDLKVGIRDAGWVQVLEGIADGEWVVTRHAYAVKLASQAPASFGHGHAH